MTTVHDIAKYILEKQSPMTAMKLQKLVYYSQVWSLLQGGEPLFAEHFQAWVNGPVVRELYDEHRGAYQLSAWPKGDSTALSAAQRSTVDAVLLRYGDLDGEYLSALTHKELPWLSAREGLGPDERSSKIITHEVMATSRARTERISALDGLIGALSRGEVPSVPPALAQLVRAASSSSPPRDLDEWSTKLATDIAAAKHHC